MARLKGPDGRSGLILCRTSQATIDKGIPIIASAKGTRVFDQDGNTYLDLTSGVTRPVHIGHGRAEMGETIAKQAAELGYFTPMSFANPRVSLRKPSPSWLRPTSIISFSSATDLRLWNRL
jgi:adenosylmethionine-8-amino-7-oxononanoate aminotransferase